MQTTDFLRLREQRAIQLFLMVYEARRADLLAILCSHTGYPPAPYPLGDGEMATMILNHEFPLG
jgi:hypothetical protein